MKTKQQALIEYASTVTDLKEYQGNYVGCCPVHQERTPSFYIYADRFQARCFGCGWVGDAFDLWVKLNGGTFTDAKKALGFWKTKNEYQRPTTQGIIKNRLRKGQVELLDDNKKEIYLSCSQALIDRAKVEVMKAGKHYAYDFEFVWECMRENSDRMRYFRNLFWSIRADFSIRGIMESEYFMAYVHGQILKEKKKK